jgi:hypothetical protein
MVNLYGIIIANEIFILAILIPVLFAWWYYRRVLISRPTKIEFHDKAGNITIYAGSWSVKSNKVEFKRSRKEKIEVKKVGDSKSLFIPPMRTEIWFKVQEGIKQTLSWGDVKEGKSTTKDKEIDTSYEVVGVLGHLINTLETRLNMSLAGQKFGLFSGLGIGFGIGVAFMILFGVTI